MKYLVYLGPCIFKEMELSNNCILFNFISTSIYIHGPRLDALRSDMMSNR